MHIELRDDEKIQVKRTQDIYTVMKKVLRRQEELNLDREHFWVMAQIPSQFYTLHFRDKALVNRS